MKKYYFLFIAILFATLFTGLQANVTLPSIISNNMVLQQNTTVTFWGWADAGEQVTITASWNSARKVYAVADAKGNWKANFITPRAGGPFKITIKGKNKIDLTNVLTGEVWLCSGQSNMQFTMGRKEKSWRTGVLNYEKEIAAANYPKIRLFQVDQKTAAEPQKDVSGKWTECTSATVYDFSAVAYYFGRELHRKLNVPIGLINSSWGGTPAESWTRKEVIESDSICRPILARYDQGVKDYPRLYKVYEDTLAKWKKDVAEGRITGDQAKKAPQAPMKPLDSKQPCVLYNAMIAPLIPYSIKGVIWYQGEQNAQRAWQYRKLFPNMIANWRSDWKEGNFPFYFVQIAPHRSQNPEIREAQLMALRSVPNTGMAVITDSGDSLNIHPLNKEVVGHRLALWAFAKTYGFKNLVYSGPLYKSMKVEGNKIIISFDYVDGGLVAKGGALTEFTIAGEDRQFVPANAVISGNNVVVSSPSVKNPVAVRFAWKYVPKPNFFNKVGLPASPFRTDVWPGATFGRL
ncbi:MAG: sialate O-acetylesterase [Bacteroidota bacterium]|nr:sialate O-acetylesterase [Bacteroidota bacterium]